MRAATALAAVLLTAGCGSPTAPAGNDAGETLTLRSETAQFQIFAGPVSDALVRDVADRLAAERPRVMADLGVASIAPVRVRIWQSEAAWSAVLTQYFGQRLPATGYITGPEELRLLATSRVAINATHELAHAISLYVNPAFANNPRWLWEAVALYENGELVNPRTLPYLTTGRPPTLQALNADITASQQIYEIGYTLAEFVVVTFGRDGLLRLVRANGDVTVLGLTPPAFEAAWYSFVRDRYLS